MDGFTLWWNGLELAQQVLYCIAAPATLILIIQTLLICLGFGHGGEGVNFSDTSGIDGLDAPDMSGVDMPGVDMPDGDFSADGHDQGYTDGSNPGDFAAFHLFSFQGVIAFLCVFSWIAVACLSGGLNIYVSLLIGFILGFGAMFGVAKIIQLSSKLQQNGNINIKNMLGQYGTVYIPIPASRKGSGKVNISAGERFIEFEAVTDGDEPLPSNTQIRVCDIRSGDTLVVEKQD